MSQSYSEKTHYTYGLAWWILCKGSSEDSRVPPAESSELINDFYGVLPPYGNLQRPRDNQPDGIELVERFKPDNAVIVDEHVLDRARKRTKARAERISRRLIRGVSDVLALDKAFDIAQHAAADGLRVNVNVARGSAAIVGDLLVLDVIRQQLSSMDFPPWLERHYLRTMVDTIIPQSVESMRRMDKEVVDPSNTAFLIRATPNQEDRKESVLGVRKRRK